MNKQTFIQLIKDPSGISPEQLLELEKVVAGFPYCQAAHILIAKQAADAGSMLADQKLKKASAYTLDRKNLKKLITGVKEKEFQEIKNPNLKELPVIEKIEEKIPKVEKQVEEIPVAEEKIPEETISTLQLTSEETTSVKGALTDEKRDEIIRELQENLKRLHDIKIKTAWEEIPKEIEVIGVNDTPVITEIKETEPEPPSETIENTALPQEELSEEWFEESKEEVETVEFYTPTIFVPPEEKKESTFTEWLNPVAYNYPVRTEDVVVKIKETEADTDLLIEYLGFLEEKRSIFRKNKKKEGEIIDRIIKEDPTIPKLDINNLPDNSVDLASKSIIISKGPVSENFAKILSLQGKREKAIEIYEQLILKNPEKKPYFEAQIEKLKNRI